MFLSQVMKDFVAGELDLICPEMELRQEGTDSPIVYTGSGMITCSSKRQLQFRLICSQTTSPEQEMKRFVTNDQHIPGVILSASSYYLLRATDLVGQTWESVRVYTDSNSGPGGVCISGDLHTLTHREPFEFKTKKMEMMNLRVLEELDPSLPFNKVTHNVTEVAGEPVGSNAVLNRAEIAVDALRVVLCKEDTELLVKVETDEGVLPR